jgi:hypothetical protein
MRVDLGVTYQPATLPEKVRYLERKEVSAYLRSRGIRLSPRTLTNLANQGKGPRYELFTATKALYTEASVDAWIEERFARNRRK